jgi:dual-specificity kinase
VRQLLQAVAFMHDLTLVHTDLKPENVLFLDQDLVTVPPPPGSK